MDPQPALPTLSWRELDALKKRLNQETIARRQSPQGSSEDVFASRMFGGRTRVFVDASGRPIN